VFRDSKHREELKALNKILHSALSADATFDFARILRVPSTQNIKPGYPAECKLISFHPERRYTISDIRRFELSFTSSKDKDLKSETEAEKESSSDKGFSPSKDGKIDLRQFNLSEETIHIIETGDASDYKSRSERDHSVVCRLVLAGATDSEIEDIFRQYPVGDKYHEKGNGERYLELSIEKARKWWREKRKGKQDKYEDILSELDEMLSDTLDLSTSEISKLIDKALKLIVKLKKTDQDRYIKILSDKFDCRQTSLRDDMKRLIQEGGADIQFSGRHFGNIYEVDGYSASGKRKIGYVKDGKFGAFPISTFTIKPKSKLWIDDKEAVNATFQSEKQEIEDIVIERQNWNSIDSFMSVIPSTDMNWSGESRKDVQSVMSIVNSYDVPVQVATRQVGWQVSQASRLTKAEAWHTDKIWVAKELNMDKNGRIEPVKVFYYPMGGSNLIDGKVNYEECSNARFDELKIQAEKLLELNETDVMIPIIGWFHAAFTKRWWLSYSNLRHFPHLNVAGSRGSGKSTLLAIMWSMFGWTGEELLSCNATRFALMRIFSATNSYPTVLDEFKTANMPEWNVSYIREFMRHSYGGMVDQRGRPDQSIVEYHLTTPVCLIGETPFYPLEAAAIERTIPVHMSINAIDTKTELGRKRSQLCEQLQKVDWTGYLPRYIRYLTDIDFEKMKKYSFSDAVEYLLRDVPRRILDNIAAVLFGFRLYELFTHAHIDDEKVMHAVQTIAKRLCGEAGNRGKLAFELALEQMAVMAETGRLLPETHYLIIEDTGEIALRISTCLSEFRRFARETNWTGEVLDDNAYRRQIAEIQEEGRLIVETSKLVRGWQENKARRAVIIQSDENIDLSGFMEEDNIESSE